MPSGSLVEVPFGRRQVLGVVVGSSVDSSITQLKTVNKIIHAELLDPHQMALLEWCWRYYQHPAGEVLAAAVPKLLRATIAYQKKPELEYYLTTTGRQLDATVFARAPRQLMLWKALQCFPLTRLELRALTSGWSAICQRLEAKGWLASRPQQQADPIKLDIDAKAVQLNQQQQTVSDQISQHLQHYHCCLLYGVTGSGKTEVYIDLIRQMLSQNRQVLLLVPEIGLITQLVQRIQQQLAVPVGTFHSGMSNIQRAQTWMAAGSGGCNIVVGTRSAVFLPLAKPGMIIIDEEHDPGYKQFEGFHYSARDVAIKRAKMLDIPIVLGTATPSLESMANVKQQRYSLMQLAQRHAQLELPDWLMVDCRATPSSLKESKSGTSYGLLHADVKMMMQVRLEAGEQILVFQNRRGYAPLLQCAACGWQADCLRCSAHMTWHRRNRQLQCHHCEHVQVQPAHCPNCSSPGLEHLGSGTEQLEQALAESFMSIPVYRVDSDSMRGRQAMQLLRDEVLTGNPCILVGTQMLTKGHHFPNINLVVVIDVDQALFSADFRATERLVQQLVQVAGRAGRGHSKGRILLQTRQPEHALLKSLMTTDYWQIAEQLLELRQQACFPPFAAQVILRADAMQAGAVEQFLRQARTIASKLDLPGDIFGPLPALLEKRAGRYRYQLWWQAEHRKTLQRFLPVWVNAIQNSAQQHGVRWHIDVDPVAL